MSRYKYDSELYKWKFQGRDGEYYVLKKSSLGKLTLRYSAITTDDNNMDYYAVFIQNIDPETGKEEAPLNIGDLLMYLGED